MGQEAPWSPEMGEGGPTKAKGCDEVSDRWAQESPKSSHKGAQGAPKGQKDVLNK